jgi:hypothetical protein
MGDGNMERKMKKQLKENLAMLKDILEAKCISPATQPIPIII